MSTIESKRPKSRMALLFKHESTYDAIHKACHSEDRSVRYIIERAVRKYFKLD